ncbi:MAG: DcaP family trimeric outer membrane transporter [Pseudomonadota bacterium]
MSRVSMQKTPINRRTGVRSAGKTGLLAGKAALTLAIALALSPPALAQDDDRVAELEARVAELEALVRQLVESGNAPQAPAASGTAPATSAQVEARAEAAAEQKVTEMLAQEKAAQEEKAKRHSLKIGGYVKADFMYSDFSGGPVAGTSVGRDFYVPSTVPVGDQGQSYTDFHAQESRIFVSSEHNLESGDYLKAYVELDFLVGDNGDERISNSYQPRMRHAYLQWNNWLFGQTWNTIFNVGALPELLDFVGPAESTVFGRQVMVRYTKGPWQLSIENPETTITNFGGAGRVDADDNKIPDLVARYNFSGDWGQWSIAGILRELAYENQPLGIDSTETGYGLSVAGKFNVGDRDDLRWMVTAGSGLGRYVGLNIVTGAALDENGELEAIDTVSAFVAYRHHWTEHFRSSAAIGWFSADHPTDITGLNVTEEATSFHANLIWTPLPKLDIGVEYIFANREEESGRDGDLNRFQFSAKYAY